MKFLWMLPVLVVGTTAVSHGEWHALMKQIHSLAKVTDTTEPSPNSDCDPPFKHPYVFECNVEGKRSKERPSSVHNLMYGDIDVIGALGDSITAGAAAGACDLNSTDIEYRGISWSIGGDNTIEETMTLTNIFKRYNPNIYGFSFGQGEENSENARFNCAVSGGESADLYDQAQELVGKIKADENVNMEEDWKLVTIFIGGNDLCESCTNKDRYSAEQYVENFRKGMDYLYQELPRTVVNIIGMLYVPELVQLTGEPCDSIHSLYCPCMKSLEPDEKEEVTLLIQKYQVLLENLALQGPYHDKDEFTVLYQPFFEKSKMPSDENGNVDKSYFSPDCFHFSAKGHALGAKAIWNNMIEPFGEKQREWEPEGPLLCPKQDFPYIYTKLNSLGLPQARASYLTYMLPALLSTIYVALLRNN